MVRQETPLLVLDASFDSEISHELLGLITSGTKSLEYYWLDRWYNVFRLSQPAGQLRNYYCNVNMPPDFDGQTLRYVDLDIDVLVEPDFSYRILDLEDFEENAARFGYPDLVRAASRKALDSLVELIETRAFPFNQEAMSDKL